MTEAVVAALITAVGGVAAQWLVSRASGRDLYARLDKQNQVSYERLDGRLKLMQADVNALSSRVDRHNQVIDRTYRLETRLDVMDEKIKHLQEGEK